MATISELVAKATVVDSDQIATDNGIQTTKLTVAQVKNYVLLGNCATATKLNAKANINGLEFDGSADVSNYGVCTTVAGTAEKAVSITDFDLLPGAEVFVSFSNVNSASNITLNVSAKGAKPIKLWGDSVSGDMWNANDILHLKYDGTNWNIVNVNSTMITYATPPDISTAVSISSGYVTPYAGWLYVKSTGNITHPSYVSVNGVIMYYRDTDRTSVIGSIFMVAKGATIILGGTGTFNEVIYYACMGE